MTADEQHALSIRYNHNAVGIFTELRPGVFVVYNSGPGIALITEDWNEVLTAYRNRTPYNPKPVNEVSRVRGLKIEVKL